MWAVSCLKLTTSSSRRIIWFASCKFSVPGFRTFLIIYCASRLISCPILCVWYTSADFLGYYLWFLASFLCCPFLTPVFCLVLPMYRLMTFSTRYAVDNAWQFTFRHLTQKSFLQILAFVFVLSDLELSLNWPLDRQMFQLLFLWMILPFVYRSLGVDPSLSCYHWIVSFAGK